MRSLSAIEISAVSGGADKKACMAVIKEGGRDGMSIGALVGAIGGVGGAIIGAGLGALIGGALATNDSTCQR
jgi:hypothetical protein